jgi:hypothetical protein
VRIVPLTLLAANALVLKWHRHHKPIVGHRFSLGVKNDDGELIGAAIIGHPSARTVDQDCVVEVRRLVTNGTPNACSMLYQAAARTAKEMGFEHIHTFILASEPGTSLKASGWSREVESPGGFWRDEVRHGQQVLFDLGASHPTGAKVRWGRKLR